MTQDISHEAMQQVLKPKNVEDKSLLTIKPAKTPEKTSSSHGMKYPFLLFLIPLLFIPGVIETAVIMGITALVIIPLYKGIIYLVLSQIDKTPEIERMKMSLRASRLKILKMGDEVFEVADVPKQDYLDCTEYILKHVGDDENEEYAKYALASKTVAKVHQASRLLENKQGWFL